MKCVQVNLPDPPIGKQVMHWWPFYLITTFIFFFFPSRIRHQPVLVFQFFSSLLEDMQLASLTSLCLSTLSTYCFHSLLWQTMNHSDMQFTVDVTVSQPLMERTTPDHLQILFQRTAFLKYLFYSGLQLLTHKTAPEVPLVYKILTAFLPYFF